MKLDVEGNWLTGYKVDIVDAVKSLSPYKLGRLLMQLKNETVIEALSVNSDVTWPIMYEELKYWEQYVSNDYKERLKDPDYTELEDYSVKEHKQLINSMKVVLEFLNPICLNNS